MLKSAIGQSAALLNSEMFALVLVKDRHIVWANQAMHSAFGYELGELIDQPTRIFFPDEESYEAFGKATYAALENGQIHHVEIPLIRKDGISGWFEFNASRLEEYPDTAVVALIDRTQCRQAAEQLAIQADILSAITDGVNVVSLDGIMRYTNSAFDRMFGYGEGEPIGQNIAVINAETVRSQHDAAHDIMDVLNRTGTWQGDLLNRRKDGSTFWTNAQITSHYWERWGTVWISVQRDITERKRMQEALQSSEERYRCLVDHTSDGIFIADSTGRYVDANLSGLKMLGYTLEELRKMTVTDVISADDVSRMPEQFAKLRTEIVVISEWQFIRKDGSSFYGEVSGRQLPDGRLIGILRDITKRKQTEWVLKENEERLDLALSGSGLVLWDWHISTREVIAGKGWYDLLGYRPEELGRNEEDWLRLIDTRDLAKFEHTLADHLQGESPFFYSEHRLRHKEGHTVAVEASGKITLRDDQGNPLRMLGTIRDVSLRQRLSDEGMDLLKRIETLIRDATSVTPRRTDPEDTADAANSLTRRQRQILGMIAKGMTSAEIGKHLELATNTVVSHRRALMAKLNLHSTAELTRFAMDHGLLDPK